MKDSVRVILGLLFLLAAVVLAFIMLVVGWLGWELRSGVILSVGTFSIFLVLAVYMFLKLRSYSWIPAILGSAYTLLWDPIPGLGDDFLALITGALASALLTWFLNRRQPQPQSGPERPPDELPE